MAFKFNSKSIGIENNEKVDLPLGHPQQKGKLSIANWTTTKLIFCAFYFVFSLCLVLGNFKGKEIMRKIEKKKIGKVKNRFKFSRFFL